MPKTRVVFLDAGTVDWKDLPLRAFQTTSQFKSYHSTNPGQVVKRATGFTHVITNKVILNRESIKALRGVKAIHVAATGVNNVDLNAARECGIAVTNVRGYSTESVVQLTFTLLLALSSRLPEYQKAVGRGDWSKQPFFSLTSLPFFELSGKTIGIIGFGNIGKRVAQVAENFGMKVLIARLPGKKYAARENKGRVSLADLLRKSDAVTIHAPLSEITRNLISEKELALMKKTALLINMARGGIVNEEALAKVLRKKQIAGAASDVLVQEPPPRGHVLYNAPGFILTPHIAWASFEARKRLVEEVLKNIQSFEKGVPYRSGSASNRLGRNRLV